ncbi:MAG TPA: hypothetical protein VMW06_04855 [Desulfobacterales bacterium]|nr:hypothetical protein [Desulfobacterales bacterium]
MEKFCVFCGQRPKQKNKEHIIPKWLIELTGDPNRVGRFGIDKRVLSSGLRNREFAIDQFTCPSCSDCNSKFSDLEDASKTIITKLINWEPLSDLDFDILLDWFDKVRIGLWLACYYLDNNISGIYPKFYISNRIGTQDRMLAIYQADYERKGLTWIGSDTMAFSFAPCCFSLLVNDVYFTNISTNFLISRRIGFPFPTEGYNRKEDGLTMFKVTNGLERMILPLLRKPLKLSGTELYQPIYSFSASMHSGSTESETQFYDTEYVRTHSLDSAKGIGKIFLKTGRKLHPLSHTASLDWIPDHKHDEATINRDIIIQTMEYQMHLDELGPSLDSTLSPEEKRYWKRTRQLWRSINRKWIEFANKQYQEDTTPTIKSSGRKKPRR